MNLRVVNVRPTAAELSMQDAFIEGQRAGRLLLGASMNPYQNDEPEHAAWERGRAGAQGAIFNKAA